MGRQLGIWLLHAFQQQWFQYLVLPVVAALVTIGLRALSRQTKPNEVFSFKKEDLLVGVNLGVTGFFTLTTALLKASEKYTTLKAAMDAAQASNNIAPLAQAQQGMTELFTFLLGLTASFVVFLVALFLMALRMSRHGWETPAGSSVPQPKTGYILIYDALGLLLLTSAITILGELR